MLRALLTIRGCAWQTACFQRLPSSGCTQPSSDPGGGMTAELCLLNRKPNWRQETVLQIGTKVRHIVCMRAFQARERERKLGKTMDRHHASPREEAFYGNTQLPYALHWFWAVIAPRLTDCPAPWIRGKRVVEVHVTFSKVHHEPRII